MSAVDQWPRISYNTNATKSAPLEGTVSSPLTGLMSSIIGPQGAQDAINVFAFARDVVGIHASIVSNGLISGPPFQAGSLPSERPLPFQLSDGARFSEVMRPCRFASSTLGDLSLDGQHKLLNGSALGLTLMTALRLTGQQHLAVLWLTPPPEW